MWPCLSCFAKKNGLVEISYKKHWSVALIMFLFLFYLQLFVFSCFITCVVVDFCRDYSSHLDEYVFIFHESEYAKQPKRHFATKKPHNLFCRRWWQAEGGSEGVTLLINNHHTNTRSCFSQSDMLSVWRRYPHSQKHAATQSVYTGHWADLEAVTMLWCCEELLFLRINWTLVNDFFILFFSVYLPELLP